MTPLNAASKPPGSKAAHRRATLPAFGRRLSRDGVRGDAPQINRCRGRQLFARWGGEIYSAPPGWLNPRGRGCLPVRRGA